jgi:hypothetical protein
MKYLIYCSFLLICSCSYSINLIHSEGSATDLVDEPEEASVTWDGNLNV